MSTPITKTDNSSPFVLLFEAKDAAGQVLPNPAAAVVWDAAVGGILASANSSGSANEKLNITLSGNVGETTITATDGIASSSVTVTVTYSAETSAEIIELV